MEPTVDLISTMPELAEVEFIRKRWDKGIGEEVTAVGSFPSRKGDAPLVEHQCS